MEKKNITNISKEEYTKFQNKNIYIVFRTKFNFFSLPPLLLHFLLVYQQRMNIYAFVQPSSQRCWLEDWFHTFLSSLMADETKKLAWKIHDFIQSSIFRYKWIFDSQNHLKLSRILLPKSDWFWTLITMFQPVYLIKKILQKVSQIALITVTGILGHDMSAQQKLVVNQIENVWTGIIIGRHSFCHSLFAFTHKFSTFLYDSSFFETFNSGSLDIAPSLIPFFLTSFIFHELSNFYS